VKPLHVSHPRNQSSFSIPYLHLPSTQLQTCYMQHVCPQSKDLCFMLDAIYTSFPKKKILMKSCQGHDENSIYNSKS
jgi:hypothetical protein